MNKRNILLILLISFNIAADQYSKTIVREKVIPGSQTEIFGDLLQLMNVENSGAFLGMGSESNPTIKLIFLLILPVVVILCVLYYLFTNKSLDKLTSIGLSCIVGGGLANLYDRFLYGSVTDFLFMDFGVAKTGIFNLADLSVTTGMILILLSTFKEKSNLSTGQKI